MRCSLFILLVSCSSPPATLPAKDAAPTEDEASADSAVNEACTARAAMLAAALDDGRVAAKSPGAAAAVITQDCGLWEGASGTSTKSDPLTPRHLAWVGSVTKTFVSETVLRLVEAQKLGLDDAVAKWISSFPNSGGITVRQLLSHQSGVYNYTDDPNFQTDLSNNPGRMWKPEELVAYASMHPPYFAPGKGWHYSNTNYVMLAMIVEQVTNGKLSAALRSEAFEPAALTETFFDKEPTITGPRVHGFDSAGHDVTKLIDMSFALGAGGVLSTPADLAKWAQKLYEGNLFGAPMMSALLTFRDTGWSDGMQYGLGVMQWPAQTTGKRAVGHGGDQPGYHSWMIYFPDDRTAVAAYVNSDAADRFAVTQALLEVLQGSRPPFD
jgi:D-alanyl-D-alanine carboxypeptidase